jgi:hypothetical protein
MSRKDSKSIKSIKETLKDEKYKLIAFIAISDEGCQQICYGAEDRGDLVKIVGELQLFVLDIHDRLNDSERRERIEELLGEIEIEDLINEGDEDVRVLN